MFKKLAATALRKCGLARFKPSQLELCLTAIARSGFSPQLIFDVGANTGNWTRTALHYFPTAKFELFEPQPDLRPAMQDLTGRANVRVHQLGVGRQNGSCKLTLTARHDSCTFRYDEADAARLGLSQIDGPVCTLDSFVQDQKLGIPDICKIDAEGWDLDVLEGARTLLGRTEVFFVEACMVSGLQANSLEALTERMTASGYVLSDFTDLNRSRPDGALWLVEAVFLRQGGAVGPALENFVRKAAREASTGSVFT